MSLRKLFDADVLYRIMMVVCVLSVVFSSVLSANLRCGKDSTYKYKRDKVGNCFAIRGDSHTFIPDKRCPVKN